MVLHPLWQAMTGAMLSWYEAKMFVERASLVSSDALHVVVGVIVWLLLALALRRSVSSWLPWLGLLALVLCNEAVDLWVERWPDPAMQLGESAKDILLTMTLPTVLMFAVRLRPNLFRAPPARRR
jgi:TRAP-type uncharacterized transport system fused permease subunit